MSVSKAAQVWLKQTHFIDGEEVAPSSGRTIDVVFPGTGKVFTQIAAGNAADVDAAVKAAKRTFKQVLLNRLFGVLLRSYVHAVVGNGPLGARTHPVRPRASPARAPRGPGRARDVGHGQAYRRVAHGHCRLGRHPRVLRGPCDQDLRPDAAAAWQPARHGPARADWCRRPYHGRSRIDINPC